MHGKQILITGITGFIGSHLTRVLKQTFPSCNIVGIGRSRSQNQDNYDFYEVNLLNREALFDIINRIKPDYIFHLAGLVFSYEWDELYNSNVMATLNLLDVVKQLNITTHIIMAGSAAEYGSVTSENLPVSETYLAVPKTPYAMTKLWQTFMAQYHHSDLMSVTVGRVFNVIGSGSSRQLSAGDFLSQIKDIMLQRQPPTIIVGDLQIKRDFLDVNDVCFGMIALALQGQNGEIYNICSGVSVAYSDILRIALSVANIEMTIKVADNKLQNTYVRDSCGCNAKIKRDTKWRPVVSLNESIKSVLGHS